MHLDGARIFNACVSLQCDPSDIAQYFDSVSICLAKGVGAPIGACLIGNAEFIDRATDLAKALGGLMR